MSDASVRSARAKVAAARAAAVVAAPDKAGMLIAQFAVVDRMIVEERYQAALGAIEALIAGIRA